MTESVTTRMVGVALPTLRELRSAILAGSDPGAAVNALREAGYAGGDDIFAAFEHWLTESSDASSSVAGDLALDEFGAQASEFFRNAGWGDVTFTPDDPEGVAVVDISNCWESGDGSARGNGCQITTGVLAAFFGRIAGYPVAVLETECCDGDGSRCRFLLGNADVMSYKWQEMQQG